MLGQEKENLIKELNKLRGSLKEDVGHLRRLRKEIKLSIKRLERKRKLPGEVNAKIDQIDMTILIQFLQAYRNLINRAEEHIKEELEELEKPK